MSNLVHRTVRVTKAEILALYRPCESWRNNYLDKLMLTGFISLSTDPQKNLALAFSLPDWYDGGSPGGVDYETVFYGLSFIFRFKAESPDDFARGAYHDLIAQYLAILADDVLLARKATRAYRR